MGMAPRGTREGDVIVILFGGRFPFVLRSENKMPEKWTLIGTIYVHGIMEVSLART